MTKVNNGIDMIAQALGSMTGGALFTGTATTAPTATTFTCDGASFTASSGGPPETGGLVGRIVYRAGVYGIIVKNTTTVLTVDMWHDPTAPGTVASTPATGQWVISPGAAPAGYMGLSVASRAIAAADPFLTNDGTTVSELWNASGGGNRKLCTYAHTLGTATYTLSTTFTWNANDTQAFALFRVGVFQHAVNAAPSTTTTGIMLNEINVTSPPTLNTGDTFTPTVTYTIS